MNTSKRNLKYFFTQVVLYLSLILFFLLVLFSAFPQFSIFDYYYMLLIFMQTIALLFFRNLERQLNFATAFITLLLWAAPLGTAADFVAFPSMMVVFLILIYNHLEHSRSRNQMQLTLKKLSIDPLEEISPTVLKLFVIDPNLTPERARDIFHASSYQVSLYQNESWDVLAQRLSESDLVIIRADVDEGVGLDILRQIRTLFSPQSLPILMIASSLEERKQCFVDGANEVILDSQSREDLMREINEFYQTKRIQRSASQTQLLFQQAQIKPHFLFNAISVISSLIDRDPNKAKETLQNLAIFLRNRFDFDLSSGLIDLNDEMDLVEAYLDIERVRFGDRLVVHIDRNVSQSVKVPVLSIQPLVENAVIHGVLKRRLGGEITVRLSEDKQYVYITVIDNGVGMSPEIQSQILSQANELGLGVYNIHQRLLTYFNRGLEIQSTPEGTLVRFSVPLKKGNV
jgi:sensor histidine kinase YesM